MQYSQIHFLSIIRVRQISDFLFLPLVRQSLVPQVSSKSNKGFAKTEERPFTLVFTHVCSTLGKQLDRATSKRKYFLHYFRCIKEIIKFGWGVTLGEPTAVVNMRNAAIFLMCWDCWFRENEVLSRITFFGPPHLQLSFNKQIRSKT